MTVFNPQDQAQYEPYKNRWIAIVDKRVIGVGLDADQAYRAAKKVRPKGRPTLFFVDDQGRSHPQPPDLKRWLEDELLVEIARIFQQADQELYLVGGIVRDGLLGRLNRKADIDLIVPAEALFTARSLADHLGGAYYPIDPERGVGRIMLADQRSIDIAAYRGASLAEDLHLRDFTINAIALRLSPQPTVLLDPGGGQADLAQRTIRAVSERIMLDDPLRAVRAVRLAAQFDFTILPETQALLRGGAAGLQHVSPERLRDEMMKLLQVERPGQAIARLHDLDLLSQILPEVVALIGVEQSPPHYQPVFEHTLAVLNGSRLLNLAEDRLAFLESLRPELQAYLHTELASGLSRRTLLILAALLHDLGKPATFRRGSDQRIRFWNHAQVGANLASEILTRWRVSNQVSRFVTALVEHHQRPLSLAVQPPVNRRAIHRFLVALEDAAPAVALLALMDHLGTYDEISGQAEWRALIDVVFKICQAYFAPKPLPLLDGQAIMAQLQLPPGPIIGQILAALREAQAVEQVTTPAEAVTFITQLGLERGWVAGSTATSPADDEFNP